MKRVLFLFSLSLFNGCITNGGLGVRFVRLRGEDGSLNGSVMAWTGFTDICSSFHLIYRPSVVQTPSLPMYMKGNKGAYGRREDTFSPELGAGR